MKSDAILILWLKKLTENNPINQKVGQNSWTLHISKAKSNFWTSSITKGLNRTYYNIYLYLLIFTLWVSGICTGHTHCSTWRVTLWHFTAAEQSPCVSGNNHRAVTEPWVIVDPLAVGLSVCACVEMCVRYWQKVSQSGVHNCSSSATLRNFVCWAFGEWLKV